MLKTFLNPNLFDPKKLESVPTRNGYGEGLVEAGEKDKNIVVLCADLTESTRCDAFAKKFPERFIEVGVAEQNMAGLAAGMAEYGKIPFISSFAIFSPGRNWEQIRAAIAYGERNVKIASSHSGISVGADGATHQGIEDIALMRVLPKMTIFVPCDALETKKAIIEAAKIKGPVYLRFGRGGAPLITTSRTPFEIGKAQVFREGKDASIITCGMLMYEALLAAECLAGNLKAISILLARYPEITKRIKKSKLHGYSMKRASEVEVWNPKKIRLLLKKAGRLDVEVINSSTIKPFDAPTIIKSAKKTGLVVTAEEHQIHGGLFSAVSEILSSNHPTKILPVAIPDIFGESGNPDELFEKYGLTAPWIIRAILG